MSEYWTPLEQLLAQDTAVVNPSVEIPRMLVAQHFVAPENESAVRELLAEHSDTYVEDDSEYDYYCQCGKWLERDQYELPDHQSTVLDDAGLLIEEQGPQRPPRPMSTAPVPAAFQYPRRVIHFTPSGMDEYHPDTTHNPGGNP